MLFPSLLNRGGFFSDYYLGTVFGRTGRRKSLVTKEVEVAFRRLERLAERAERASGGRTDLREVFARPLLRDVFGYHLGEGEEGIHPLYRSAEDEAAGRPPLLLAYVGTFDEDLDARRDGKAASTERLAEALALASADLRYGLLITGERIRLIRRRGEGPRGAYLELDVPQCLETEDRESLAAALRLFGAEAFTPAEDGSLPIDVIERESREHAERVSEDLKRAVFQTAERLLQALLDASGGVGDIIELRDAALTCLYRLLFVLYAEARDPRLLANPLYRNSYSLDAVVREVSAAADPPAANRYGLWERILALFAIHREGLPGMEGFEPIPARGGELFDPTTRAGQILEDVRLPDRTVAEVVLGLTTTAPRRGVGKERISFRELDVEQLGAVYEGLLEYEPRVADRTTIEVKVQGRTYALSPADLVRLVREKDLRLKGPIELVAGTEAEALHHQAADDDALDEDPGEGDVAPEEAPAAEERSVRKNAPALLLRRFEPGEFHFVPGPGRKGSGSFYTPLPLVQDLVRHALGPLVEGRSAAEIERLRVLDPACVSAHFLVEAMRFLGQALHRAYVEEYGGKSPPGFRGEWDADHRAADEEAKGSEARAWCKRRVAERCLFGVDLNPTAVQLARVSLWIESLAGDRPLSYFAHHVRCGNSILGTWLERLGEPPLPELRSRGPVGISEIFADPVTEAIRKAAELRELIDRAVDAGAVEADTLEEYRFKDHQRRRAEEVLAAARLLFDLRSAAAFVPEIWAEWPQLCSLADDTRRLRAYAEGRPWWPRASEVIARERFFHWELEFPEVFLGADGGGFDAVLGNPPFLGGLKISDVHSPEYRRALVCEYEGFGGTADLCVLFYRRGFRILRPGGSLAMVGTNSIGQGDTRQAGLKQLLDKGGTITMARRFVTWPGEANVEVNLIAVRKGPASGAVLLDGKPVPSISSRLDDLPEAEPARLSQNEGKAFIGDYVRGIGFVLEPQEAERLLAEDPRNAECILPYLNGEDLNSDPEQRPSRYVICFHDWPLEKAKEYPALLRIVEDRVRPERMKVNQSRDRAEWWRFSAYRRELRGAIAPLGRVLARSRVSELHAVAFVPKGLVYNEQTVVFAFDDDYHFALLQSNVHEQWVWREASTLESRNRYTPTDCFQTFPFPQDPDPRPAAEAARLGAAYHAHRRKICTERRIGLTQVYKLFHKPACTSPDIAALRDLHTQMDRAVLACYGWADLDPHHQFRDTDRGQTRFTVSDAARREIIARLLELNQALAAAEREEHRGSARVRTAHPSSSRRR